MKTWSAQVIAALAPALFGALVILLSAHPLGAQTVSGRLLEQGTRRPIASGLVVLLDSASAPVDQAVTNSEGRFLLRSRNPGSFYIRAEGLGYQTRLDGILELGEGGQISIEFYLRPSPIVLDSLLTAVERDRISIAERRYLQRQGFYDRMALGFGDFITPGELETRLPNDPRSLFQGQSAIRVEMDPYMGQQAVRLKQPGGFCSPALFVDGAKITFAGRRGAVVLEDVVRVEDISAVEIYRRLSSVPLQYNIAGPDTNCGVLLVWTK